MSHSTILLSLVVCINFFSAGLDDQNQFTSLIIISELLLYVKVNFIALWHEKYGRPYLISELLLYVKVNFAALWHEKYGLPYLMYCGFSG